MKNRVYENNKGVGLNESYKWIWKFAKYSLSRLVPSSLSYAVVAQRGKQILLPLLTQFSTPRKQYFAFWLSEADLVLLVGTVKNREQIWNKLWIRDHKWTFWNSKAWNDWREFLIQTEILIPLALALRRQRQAGLWVQVWPALQREFQHILYLGLLTEKSCLNCPPPKKPTLYTRSLKVHPESWGLKYGCDWRWWVAAGTHLQTAAQFWEAWKTHGGSEGRGSGLRGVCRPWSIPRTTLKKTTAGPMGRCF